MLSLPAEARLFFLALEPRDAADDDQIAALGRRDLNWRLLTHLAERERLLSVLWYGLRGRAAVPRDVESGMRRRSAVIEFRMAVTRTRLEQIVSHLATQGIPALLLKGAGLAASVYPSFAQRPMNDLDVLVPASDAARAWESVRALGWTLEQEGGAEFHETFHHLKPLVDPAGSGIVLEIHRSMMPRPGPFPLSDDDVWRDSADARIGAAEVRVPSDAHMLLHLCVHFAWSHSLATGLARTVRDVEYLTAERDVDWDKFLSLVRSAHAGASAFWTLRIARTLGADLVPESVLSTLRPSLPRAIVPRLERAYIASALFDLCPSLMLGNLLWTIGMQPTRSRHGALRPWKVTEHFREAFHEAPKAPLAQRVREHARRAGAWRRFARAVVSGAPLA